MKTLFFAFAVAAATLIGGLSAQAGYTGAGGSLNNGGFITAPTTGAELLGNFSVTDFQTSFNPANRSGDFDAVAVGSTFFSGQYNFNGTILGTTLSFGSLSSFGTFSGAVTLDNRNNLGGGAQARTITVTGTFTPGDSLLSGGPSRSGTLQISLSKGSSGGSVTSSWALDTITPVSAVPEPASMAIFGLGALGLAARRFRRK